MRIQKIVSRERQTCVLPQRLLSMAAGALIVSLIASACTSEPAHGTASTQAALRYDTIQSRGFQGGSVLMGPNGHPSAFVFSEVRTGRRTVLRLDSVVAGSPRDRSRIIRAELSVPPLAADERLLIGSCDTAGHLDPALVAIIVGGSATTRYTQVRQAWRAQPAEGRFEIVPVRGITCEETD